MHVSSPALLLGSAIFVASACASQGAVSPGARDGSEKAPSFQAPPRASAEAPPVSGMLPPEVIRAEVKQHYAEFRQCYEDGLGRDATLAGRIEIRFVIEQDGSMHDAGVFPQPVAGQPGLEDVEVLTCIQEHLLKMRFPPPTGGVVRVVYPLIFSPEIPVTKADDPATAPNVVNLHGGCEEAKSAYLKQCAASPKTCPDPDPSQRPDATAYGAVLNNGRYLGACGTPSDMAVHVCAAVREGRAIAVTVRTTPGDKTIGTCVARAVEALSFPSSPGLDMARTVFAAN